MDENVTSATSPDFAFARNTPAPFTEREGLLELEPAAATPEYLSTWNFETCIYGENVVVDHLVVSYPNRESLDVQARLFAVHGARTVEGPALFPTQHCTQDITLGEDLWLHMQTLQLPQGGLVVLCAPHTPGDQLDRFRYERGPFGLHHLAIRTNDVHIAARPWAERGFRPLSERPFVQATLTQWFLTNAAGQILELIARAPENQANFDSRNVAGLRKSEQNSPDLLPRAARVPKVIPSPPVFATAAEERLHRKRRLAAAFRLFGRFGFSEGIAGHITARDPEYPDHFWVNPFGLHFSLLRASDLVLVNHKGDVVEGDRPVNEAAFAIHSQVHAARPDVVSAAHAHSVHGKSWSSLGRPLAPLTQDACAFFEDHAVFDDYTGVVLEIDEAKRIAKALGGNKAAILRNHGLLTVGRTVDEAAWWFIAMERTCQSQLLAEAAGAPIPIDDACARMTKQQVGSSQLGWFSFQPLYDLVAAQEPDFLD